MGRDEVRVGEERTPRPADRAEAAEVLGGEAQQDLVHRVEGQDSAPSARPGAPARRSLSEAAVMRMYQSIVIDPTWAEAEPGFTFSHVRGDRSAIKFKI